MVKRAPWLGDYSTTLRLAETWHCENDGGESFLKVRKISGLILDLLKSQSLERLAVFSTPGPVLGLNPEAWEHTSDVLHHCVYASDPETWVLAGDSEAWTPVVQSDMICISFELVRSTAPTPKTWSTKTVWGVLLYLWKLLLAMTSAWLSLRMSPVVKTGHME